MQKRNSRFESGLCERRNRFEIREGGQLVGDSFDRVMSVHQILGGGITATLEERLDLEIFGGIKQCAMARASITAGAAEFLVERLD